MNEVSESTVTHSTISHTEAFSHGDHFSTKSGVLMLGSTGYQAKFQHSYLHYISPSERATDFPSTIRGSSTIVISYGFLVDHAHCSCEAVYWLTMHLLLVLITQNGFVRGHFGASNFARRINMLPQNWLLGCWEGAFQLP